MSWPYLSWRKEKLEVHGKHSLISAPSGRNSGVDSVLYIFPDSFFLLISNNQSTNLSDGRVKLRLYMIQKFMIT